MPGLSHARDPRDGRRVPRKPTPTYRLADVERTHRQHPRTFSIPRSDRRRALAVGEVVKLVFELAKPRAGQPHAERMWLEVVERAGDGYVGRLDNEPAFIAGLARGDLVPFGPEHVAGIDSPGKRRLGALVGVGVDVLRRGAWPAWLAKVPPATKQDSGWRVFSAREARGGATVRALTTSTMLRAWAVADSVINIDTDGIWRWDEDALEYVAARALPARLARAAAGELGRLHAPPPDDDHGAVITKRALKHAPAFAQQMGPSKGHADDTGWAIFVGDESQAYMSNTRNSTVVPVARLLHEYPYLERVLGEPRRTMWTWDDKLADWRDVGD
jgi:hypothetical protein